MSQTDLWCMNVKGRIYGPYDTGQMRSFVTQKRLAYHSLVAPAGSRDFREALQFAELRDFFRSPAGQETGAGVGAHHPEADGAALLVVFASRQAAAKAEESLLDGQGAVIPISETVYAVRTRTSADDLRDQLARLAGGSERIFVLELDGARAAAAAVSLDELDRLTRLLDQNRPNMR